jgi:hypothetical protein
VRCGNKLKLSSDCGDSDTKKRKRGYGGGCDGSGGVCVFRESGIRLSLRFYVGAFGRNLASVALQVFSRLFLFKNRF